MRDGWTESDGAWTLVRDGRTYEVAPVGVGGRTWRLTVRHDGGLNEPVLDLGAPRSAMVVAESIASHRSAAAELAGRLGEAPVVERPGPIPGSVLRAEPDFALAGPVVDVSVTLEGKRIGALEATEVPWLARYAIGRRAATATRVHVDEGVRGRGVAAAMYDLAEEVLGLPMVPNQENGVPGGLSDLARGFWENRAAKRPVPGFGDPRAAAKLEEYRRARAVIEAESRYAGSSAVERLAFAMAAAEATGLTPEAVLARGADGEEVADVWLADADGRVFDVRGFFGRDEMIADRQRRWYLGEGVGFRVVEMDFDGIRRMLTEEAVRRFGGPERVAAELRNGFDLLRSEGEHLDREVAKARGIVDRVAALRLGPDSGQPEADAPVAARAPG